MLALEIPCLRFCYDASSHGQKYIPVLPEFASGIVGALGVASDGRVAGSKNQDAVEALPEPQTSLNGGRPKLTVTLNWRRPWTPRAAGLTAIQAGSIAYPSDCSKVSYSTEEMKTVGGCCSNQNWHKPEWSKIGSGRGFCVCADEQRRSRESGGPDGDPAHLPVPRREEGSYQEATRLRI